MTVNCSVVLATYQGERFIGEQLDSILSQLSLSDEVVVSDDASSDGTLSVITQRCDSRIRVLRSNERVGYVRNFQRAIDEARGNFVFFSDQDDVWRPGKVEQVCAALQRKAFVASDAIVTNENLELLHSSYFQQRGVRSFSTAEIFCKPCIIGATMACRSNYLKSLLPLPRDIPHDFWLSLNAAWDDEMEIICSPLLLYRRHSKVHSVTATSHRRPILTIVAERGLLAGTMIARRIWHAKLDIKSDS